MKKNIEVKASGKSLIVTDNITGATIKLSAPAKGETKITRDLSGCVTKHDKQYGGYIAHFVGALVTGYMNSRLSWADRFKKVASKSKDINAHSIRNMSSKMRVTLKPVFGIPEEQFFAEQVKA